MLASPLGLSLLLLTKHVFLTTQAWHLGNSHFHLHLLENTLKISTLSSKLGKHYAMLPGRQLNNRHRYKLMELQIAQRNYK